MMPEILKERIISKMKWLDERIERIKKELTKEGLGWLRESWESELQITEIEKKIFELAIAKLEEEERCCIRFDEMPVIPTKRESLIESEEA